MSTTVRISKASIRRAKLDAHHRTCRLTFKKWAETDGVGTTFVAGVGNPTAPVVFVGEAPGATEDKEGIPFVGAAGKILDRLLGSIDLERDAIYITNLLKRRPPDNKFPEELLPAALALMRMEIGIVDPKIVVTLGKWASCLYFQYPHMQTLVGRKFVRDGRIVVPMFHPSYVLRTNSISEAKEHMKTVKEALENL